MPFVRNTYTRVPPKYEKLLDQFPDWGKVVP